jgi:hypothetical protein
MNSKDLCHFRHAVQHRLDRRRRRQGGGRGVEISNSSPEVYTQRVDTEQSAAYVGNHGETTEDKSGEYRTLNEPYWERDDTGTTRTGELGSSTMASSSHGPHSSRWPTTSSVDVSQTIISSEYKTTGPGSPCTSSTRGGGGVSDTHQRQRQPYSDYSCKDPRYEMHG